MVLVSLQVEPFSCETLLSADRRMWKVVVVATSYSPHKLRLEDGGEPWTVWWGFRRSFVVGTRENLTFFTGGPPGTEGLETEAGTRRGRPQRGETAQVIGTAEIAGFKLSTETELDYKNFSDSRSTQ